MLWEQEKSIVASLPEKNRSVLFSRVSLVYLRYIVVARQLDVCYRNMLHVQKRKDISTVIRAVLGRVVELKNELATLDFNETPFIGAALAQLKMSPEQVDPPLTLFIHGASDHDGQHAGSECELERKQLVQRVLIKLERNPRRQMSSDGTTMTWDEAVALIQIHERARQGRLRFNLMKQIRQQKMLASRGLHKLKPAMNPNTAALKIQNAWRSFLALKRVRQLRHQEMVFLGMVNNKLNNLSGRKITTLQCQVLAWPGKEKVPAPGHCRPWSFLFINNSSFHAKIFSPASWSRYARQMTLSTCLI